MTRVTKHVTKAGKVDLVDRVTLPVKLACKTYRANFNPIARVTLAQG